MLHYGRIVLGEVIDLTKSKNSKECKIEFKFQNFVYNGCLELTMLLL